jgi:PTS system mannose-specific IIA component
MIGTLILTHGAVAQELLKAARTIAGPLPAIEALSLDWSDCGEGAKEKVKTAIARLDTGQGVLILTDMFGSTPTNVAMSFFEAGRVEVLSGVNLPMLLRLGCMPRPIESLPELAHWLQGKGQKSICLASDVVPLQKKCAPQESRRTEPVALAEKVDG